MDAIIDFTIPINQLVGYLSSITAGIEMDEAEAEEVETTLQMYASEAAAVD